MDLNLNVGQLETQAQSPTPDNEQVIIQSKQIADNLRSEQLRSTLGDSTLIQSSSTLLSSPHLSQSAQTQLLRIIGNLCFDHDENRARVHTAGIPAKVLGVIQTSLGPVEGEDNSMRGGERERSMAELLLLRAAVGALLNMSLKYDPIRVDLSNPLTLSLLLAILDSSPPSPKRAVEPVYIVHSLASGPLEEEEEEKVRVGAKIVGWTIDILQDLLEGDKSIFPPSALSSLLSIILTPSPSATSASEDEDDLLSTDLHLLTTSASLFESLSLDLPSIKQEIAFSPYTSSQSLLEALYDFIEFSSVPSCWITGPDAESREKAYAVLKSAVIRGTVESPNDDLVMERLFKERDSEGNPNVRRLKKWLEVGEKEEGREDLLICATHMLAALGRKDEHCVDLVQTYDLAPQLSKILSSRVQQQILNPKGGRPGEITQVLFGVVSLLRHLSIPVVNKQTLGDTGIVEELGVLLRRELDMVGPLQNAVVGLLKHLTAGNVTNSLRFVGAATESSSAIVSSSAQSQPTSILPLEAVLSLISRTDDVRLRSEATRTLVNVVRAFFSTRAAAENAAASPITPISSAQVVAGADDALKRRGKPRVVTKEVVGALSEMIRLSEKYPMLINEGIVGLTLLAGNGAVGATLVLDAILSRHTSLPPPSETPSSASSAMSTSSAGLPTPSRTTSLAVTASGDPPQSADMLATWIGLASSGKLATVRPEMVVNVCALLITVLRGGEVAKADKDKLDELRAKIVGPLKGASEANVESEALKKTVARALEVVERR